MLTRSATQSRVILSGPRAHVARPYRGLRDAGEDASLGTTIRSERTERGLTVAALARAIRERGGDLSSVGLRQIEANQVDTNVEPATWRAVIDEMDLDSHTLAPRYG